MADYDEIHRREGDNREFRAVSPAGGVYYTWGEADARTVAGKSGSYEPTGRVVDPEHPERRTGELISEIDKAVEEMRESLRRIRETYFKGDGWDV